MAELGLYSYCLYGKNQCYTVVVISCRNFISTFMKKSLNSSHLMVSCVNDIFTCIKRPQFYPLNVSFFFWWMSHRNVQMPLFLLWVYNWLAFISSVILLYMYVVWIVCVMQVFLLCFFFLHFICYLHFL